MMKKIMILKLRLFKPFCALQIVRIKCNIIIYYNFFHLFVYSDCSLTNFSLIFVKSCQYDLPNINPICY